MTRIATLLAGAALALGTFGSAHAAVRFTNTSPRPIVLTMRCAASSQTYRWVVAVDRTLARLYTRHPDGTAEVVSRIVRDGADYAVFFDGEGDADIMPAA